MAWGERNQRYLVSCIDQVKELLQSYVEKGNSAQLSQPAWDDPSALPPAVEYVCETFGLTGFERLVLILCAAAELDSEISQLCAKAHGSPSAPFPTFSLALAALPGAHWSAVAPPSPLRRFRLVHLYGLPQALITRCQLQVDERILHYIAGVSYLDGSLRGVAEPVREAAPVSDSQKQVASAIVQAWKAGIDPFHVQLVGPDEASKRAVAGLACRQVQIMLWQVPADFIPTRPDELEPLAQVWARESALMNAGLYISASDSGDQKSVRRLVKSITGPVFVSTGERWADLPALTFEVSKPTKTEQRGLWKHMIEKTLPASAPADPEAAKVANQFNLSAASIKSAASEAGLAAGRGEDLTLALWSAARRHAGPRLAELAQRIEPRAAMDDLVLPDREKQLLKSMISSVRQRFRVYEEWGFGADQRGLGIAALFAGDSGTGKTMAAEVIANELHLDLFRIDLSAVVSKYIGETEKNLKRIFDAAEDGGAVLLFDEADALFGKRSEVRDSHDRYANIEVGYLLQRMEAYSGLAILTTNMKDALDKAFMRRLRFAVNFPFPNEKSRKEIWKRVFPKPVPLDGIDFDRLAQLDVAGGHIRNIALAASVFAAEEGKSVGMSHIAAAAKEEYSKMERPLPGVRWG